jgi:RHS repeat-associated protein
VVAEFNADGSVNTSFGSDGSTVTENGWFSPTTGMVVLANGEIVLAGYNESDSGDQIDLCAYDADGAVDTSFGDDGLIHTMVEGNYSVANAAIGLTDGKIVVTGYAYDESTSEQYLAVAEYDTGLQYTPTYDNDGNTLTDSSDGDTYTYNAWNQLMSVENSSGTTIAAYSYLPEGYRITATEGGGATTTSYYSNQWQVIETRQSGNVTTQNVWGIDYVNDLVLRDDNSTSGSLGISDSGLGERLYAQHDANWDVTAIISTGGAVEERFTYAAYGSVTVLNASGATTTDSYNWTTMFQGGTIDAATGLYEFQRRDYNPTEERWLETDYLGHATGLNLYEFVLDAPPDAIDCSGLIANWHHLLPQAIFDQRFFSNHPNLQGVIDIDDAKWGWVMDSRWHTGSQGIHPQWNRDWQAWVNNMDANGTEITEQCIEGQLRKMMASPQYSTPLSYGGPAQYNYDDWLADLSPLDREMELRAAEVGGQSGTAVARWQASAVASALIFGAVASLDAFGSAHSAANEWYRKGYAALIAKNTGQGVSADLIHALTQGDLYQNASNELLLAGASPGGIEGTVAGTTIQMMFQNFAQEVGDALAK